MGVVLEAGSDVGTQRRDTKVEKVSNRGPNGRGPAIVSPPVDVVNNFSGFGSYLLKRHSRQIIIHAIDECVHAADETATRTLVIAV